MSKKGLRNHSSEFKAKVALEAIRGELTINQISAKYSVHASQINRWKKQALNTLKQAFSSKPQQEDAAQQKLTETLYCRIGELTLENEFLKKTVWN